jgi:tetratricopeptide (TPR) repeat protein
VAKLSRKRRFIFLALPYVALVGVLWLVNIILPHLAPSLDLPFTRDIKEEDISYRQINRAYLAPFFPAGSPLIPELKSTYLLQAKKNNSFRVLCLGESAMFGVPFQIGATIPALVRKQLRHLYPDMEIEVINLGASAINSNVIREMVPEFLSLEPDLVLVYTGHNEFFGPEGIGASWLEQQLPFLTPWKYRVRRWPLFVGVQRWIGGGSGTKADGERNLMRQVSGGAEIALNSPAAQRVFRQFEENLRDIVQGFRSHAVPLVLGDLSSNLMFPPFAPRPGAHPEELSSAIAEGRFAEAESLITRGLDADSVNAYYLYWRGRLSLSTGDSGSAVRFLERARDNDLLKFRAPGRINEIIRKIGREESVPVLPVDSLLRARSPHGITDTTFFCEHLHFTFSGYDLVAREFVQAIVNERVVRPPHQPTGSLLPFDADSLSVPWIDLGYGALSIRALTSRWPFTDMPRRSDVLERCEAWELEIVRELYSGKVGWTDACLQYADNARRHHKHAAMLTTLSALVEEYPWTYLFRYGYAAALEGAGRKSDAMEQYRRAIALKPGFPQANLDCALLLIDEGQYDEAQRHLQTVLAASGGAATSTDFRPMALYALAVIAANRDSLSTSLGLLEESLRLAPEYRAALDLRAQLQQRSP